MGIVYICIFLIASLKDIDCVWLFLFIFVCFKLIILKTSSSLGGKRCVNVLYSLTSRQLQII